MTHLSPDELQELRTELQIELRRVGAHPQHADAAAARSAGAPERVLRLLEALSRIRAGQYGTCIACRGPIAFHRLIAIPEASTCVDCSSGRMAWT